MWNALGMQKSWFLNENKRMIDWQCRRIRVSNNRACQSEETEVRWNCGWLNDLLKSVKIGVDHRGWMVVNSMFIARENKSSKSNWARAINGWHRVVGKVNESDSFDFHQLPPPRFFRFIFFLFFSLLFFGKCVLEFRLRAISAMWCREFRPRLSNHHWAH